jgi:hypothetical protein
VTGSDQLRGCRADKQKRARGRSRDALEAHHCEPIGLWEISLFQRGRNSVKEALGITSRPREFVPDGSADRFAD